MLRIGLTGGIGSGKSTVTRLFSELGVPIIDTDRIAHSLVEPGQPALAQLTAAFGHDILDRHGRLNRTKMRERVFNDETDRQRLESILHPLIRQQVRQSLETLRSSYVVIAIPLLLEKGWQAEVDRILVVDTDETRQVERTVKRDGITPEQVRQIMRTQVSRQQRLAVADDVLHNDGSPAELSEQVQRLHKNYLQLAKTPEQ